MHGETVKFNSEKYKFCSVYKSFRPVECFLITLAKMSDHRKVATVEVLMETLA